MKKILSVIFALTLLLCLSACRKINYNYSAADYTQQTDSKLSDKDAKAKKAIEESGGSWDYFKNIKQQEFDGKIHDISFSEVLYGNDVVYKSESNSKFYYNVKSGKLNRVKIKSAIVEKDANSISIGTAKNKACEFAASRCDINEYPLDSSQETEDGYKFLFRKYIKNFKTTDTLYIEVSFAGDVFFMQDNTGKFENIDVEKINLRQKWIDARIDEWFSVYRKYYDMKLDKNEPFILGLNYEGKPKLEFGVIVYENGKSRTDTAEIRLEYNYEDLPPIRDEDTGSRYAVFNSGLGTARGYE